MEAYYAAIGTVLAVFGLVWKMTSEMKKFCEHKVETCKKECDGHRGTIYRRFDEYKDHLERTHVSKEVHDIKYDQLKDDLDEIKKDVKEILKIKRGSHERS